jgi:Domain of unknown function (DUF4129)
MTGPLSARVLRFALPALVIVLVLAGLRGATRAPGWTGHFHTRGVVVGVALETVLAALLVALEFRTRRTPPRSPVVSRLRIMVRYLLGAGLIAVPLLMVFSLHVRLPRIQGHAGRVKITGKPPKLHPQPPGSLHIPWADILYGLLVLIVLAGALWCWMLMRGRGREHADDQPGDWLADEPSELGAALESGRSALRRLDDARAAIIACYLAMERSLAAAGANRTEADTPAEFLDRAAAAGLVRTAAAGQLTGLFYEARFSRHELGGTERSAAQHALRQLDADLAEPKGRGADWTEERGSEERAP